MADLALLPCNGLDKEAGALAREIALALLGKGDRLICPVLYQRSPARYKRELEGRDLLVVDGCKTGCAGKLARERGLKIARRFIITELLKEQGLKSGKNPVPDAKKLDLILPRIKKLLRSGSETKAAKAAQTGAAADLFSAPVSLREFMVGKFIFKVPTSGYFFNENDCWARVEGERARLGVSDYVQQSASDMVFFEPPAIGAEISIFDEAGALESTKTALDIISPVTGKVVAVNAELAEAPELINEDPYVKGWAVEVELSDFEGDRDLLMDCDHYFEYLKQKVEREFKDKYG